MPMHSPPHPGDFIKTEIIEPLQLTISAAAKVLGVSRPALSMLLNGRSTCLATWRYGSEGVRREDGYLDAHAVGLGYRPDAQT